VSFLAKNGKLIRKDGKLVVTDDPATCECCGGDGPCPPGKYCTWIPPDPCSTGKCQPDRIEDNPILESQCGDAPYDCRSEEACNQWYAANPNPPCDCWFCEDGTWVNKPSLNCINEGGTLGPEPPAEDCEPPPPPDKECCVECDSGAYPETCDGCPDGYDCIEEGGAIFCIKSTPVACGFEENGDYLQDTLDAIKDCEQMGGVPMVTQAPCREPPPPPNPCTGYGEYMWTGTAWELDDNTCRPPGDCRPAPPPTQPGDFVGELKRVDCQLRVKPANNPLP